MSEELKLSVYRNGERAVDQEMAIELFKAKAIIGSLRKELAALREAAGELVANAEWDGDISTVDTDDLKALRAELLQETPHD